VTNLDTSSVLLDNKFLYDSWNLIAELNVTNNAVIRSYMWGLDLSGSVQGAGGVGGLLEVNDSANGAHFAASDGNGNVAALVKGTDGTISAQYEYGPFAEPIRVTGPMGKTNPIRFSSKYTDDESDFLYYGHRYYNPSTGRWLSRDPIGEWGGVSLYACVINNPISYVDTDGMQLFPPVLIEAPPVLVPRPILEPIVRPGLDPVVRPGIPPEWLPQPAPRPMPPVSGPTPRPLYPPAPVTPPQPNPQPNPTQPQTRPDDQEGSAPHSGEWHVQLAGLKKLPHQRVIWRRQTPLTKSQGIARLEVLWTSLNAGLQSDLKDAFDDARKWVRSRPASGVPAFFPKSWPKNAGRCWHLDVEVVTGVAFVDDPRPRPYPGLIAIIDPIEW
jgi:RHS repeat-associated protein